MTTLAGDWPAEISALAHAVRPEWAAVDRVWAEVTRDHEDIHLLRQAGKQPLSFLAEAFTIAYNRRLLGEFATRLIKQSLVDEGDLEQFDKALQQLLGQSPFVFQVFQNSAFAPVNALRAFQGALHACDLVCRIDIDKRQVGTGVLIRPNLVATAAHVVLELLARTPDRALARRVDGSLLAAPDTLKRLTLTFNDFDRVVLAPASPPAGAAVALHPDWLAWGSPPTPIEQTALSEVRDVDGIAEPDGPWDLAIIRLAEGRDLIPPRFLGRPPRAAFQIHVLHHPHGVQEFGEPLLWSIGQLDEQLGEPPMRYLHDANTFGGSSGAPVFDSAWRLVALHQGGCRSLQDTAGAAALEPTARNRAVPVRSWCDNIDGIVPGEDTPYVRELRDDPAGPPHPYPVIGRRETQQRLWRGIRPGAPAADRLLIVRGAPGTGRRFTKRLVRAMVEAHGGVVAALDLANAAGDDAARFAQRIAGVLSAAPPQPPHGEALTTAPRQVRQRVAPAIYGTWEELAAHRPVWLVLEALDRVPPALADIVAGLLRRLPEYPLLRLVLVGWVDPPPPGFEPSVEELAPPTAADVAYRLTPPGTDPAGDLVHAVATLVALQPDTGYPAAHRVLAMLTPAVAAGVAAGGPS
ncbi:trypsin-like serine peptidase [Phytohabitans suffuscus]